MTATFKPTNFFAACDIVVIGRHYEACDFDNPRGELFGVAAFVYAEDDMGYRVRTHVKTDRSEADAMAPASAMAAALRARLAAGKLPVGFDRWEEVSPAYGSDAYIESRAEDDVIAWERRVEEESNWA